MKSFVLLSGALRGRARFAFILFLHFALFPPPLRSKQKEREAGRTRQALLALVPGSVSPGPDRFLKLALFLGSFFRDFSAKPIAGDFFQDLRQCNFSLPGYC